MEILQNWTDGGWEIEKVSENCRFDFGNTQYTPEKLDGLCICASFILLEQEEIYGVAPVDSGKDNIELTVYGNVRLYI